MINRHGAGVRRPPLGLACLALVVVALAGCSSGADDAAAGEPTATTTVTETTTASPSSEPPTGSPSASPTTPSTEPSADPAAGGTVPLCGTPDLSAGATVVDLSLVDGGTAPCPTSSRT